MRCCVCLQFANEIRSIDLLVSAPRLWNFSRNIDEISYWRYEFEAATNLILEIFPLLVHCNIQLVSNPSMPASLSCTDPHFLMPCRLMCSTRFWMPLRLLYESCPESIRPFWISREPMMWSWYNLAASQRGTYCVTMVSHSPVGLVSRQWEAVDWTYVKCDRRIHNDRVGRSASSRQCACPFYSSRAGFFLAKHPITQVCQSLHSPDLAPCDFWLFSKLKSPLKVRRLVNATVTQYTSSIKGISLPTD